MTILGLPGWAVLLIAFAALAAIGWARAFFSVRVPGYERAESRFLNRALAAGCILGSLSDLGHPALYGVPAGILVLLCKDQAEEMDLYRQQIRQTQKPDIES